MRFGRGAGLLAAAALAVGGLAACGDEAEPTQPSTTASPIDKGTESPSESSSASESPSGSGAHEVPAAARQKTKAGAIAFTRLWFEESGKAIQGGGISWVEAHAHQDCAACGNLIESIRTDQSKGYKADRDPVSVQGVTATERPDGGYRVEFTMRNHAHKTVDSKGKEVESVEEASATVVTDTQWARDGWILKSWIIK